MFDKMKRDDLYNMAVDGFAVDVSETATKAVIIAALNEQGVTWEMARTYDANARAVYEAEQAKKAPAGVITTETIAPEVQVLSDEPVTVVEIPVTPAPVDTRVLVRMDRENPRYEVRGYRFTSDNPFALVKEGDVDFVLSHEQGFKIASPNEAKEFYS